MSVVEQHHAIDFDAAGLSDDDVLRAALEWVNDFRAEYELPPLGELPKGTPWDAGDCVLARAAAGIGTCPLPPAPRVTSGPAVATFARDGVCQTRPIPKAVVEFAIRFDAGRYPELTV